MKVGDLVERAGATIRGPNGEKKQLEEAPYYGVVISVDPLNHQISSEGEYVRVLWRTRDGTSAGTTIVETRDLIKISK